MILNSKNPQIYHQKNKLLQVISYSKDITRHTNTFTADPDITEHKITDKDEFMVLACDGIWDCVSNQEAATFIRKEVAKNVPLKEICEKLMDHCLSDGTGGAGVGCDNMTVEIIAFLNGKSEEEWYAAIRESVSLVSPTDVPTSINSTQSDESDSDENRGNQ